MIRAMGLLCLACGAAGNPDSDPATALEVVDCLLPGRLMQLGTGATYLSARQPARLPAKSCASRGGEYVLGSRADFRAALRVWEDQAMAGDAEAQAQVGETYEKGLGVAPDYALAAVWYRRAAEQGLIRAQVNLGTLFERGLGVPRDPTQALYWYRRAAGLDSAIALDPGATAQIQPPRADLSDQHQLVERLTQALNQTRSDLDAARDQLRTRESALLDQRQQLIAAEAALDSGTPAARNRVHSLTADLAEHEVELAKLQQTVARLETDRAEQHRLLLAAQAHPNTAVPLTAPSFEIIEPPLTATRGPLEIPTRMHSTKELIGRVTAPAGLLSLSVNGAAQSASLNGLFRLALEVAAVRVPVEVVAVDQQGQRSALEFVLVPTSPAPSPPPSPAPPPVEFGRYHALIIGIDRYRHEGMRPLKTPIADATRLADLLSDQYGFAVERLENPTRYEILSALNRYRETLRENDNLLLYYAGHGALLEGDGVTRGQWQPADAEPNNPANWISNTAITDQLSILRAKQVLVIADSCYSGALTRSSVAQPPALDDRAARQRWLQQMAPKRSRTALTSGGLAPVLDAGGGNHSVFAAALLDALADNREVLEAQRLFQLIAARVALAAERFRFEQTPEYAPIRFAGHEAGDFFFVPVADG